MPRLFVSDLIKNCRQLTIRSLSRDFRSTLTPSDVQSIRRIESEAVQYNSHLDINEVAVLLYGFSRFAPKNTPVAGPLCSRINSLYEGINVDYNPNIALEHISTISWSLNRIIKYSEDVPLSIGDTSILLSRLFTEFVESYLNNLECELSQVFTPKEFSKLSVCFALLDKLLTTRELFSNETKTKSDNSRVKMYNSVGKILDGIFLSCLKECERVKFDIGASAPDLENWHLVYIKNGINILKMFITGKYDIETVTRSFEKFFSQLNLGDVESSKTIADVFIVVSKGKGEYNRELNAMLNELSVRDLSAISNDVLLGIVEVLSDHYIQHSDILESICNEFSNRSYMLPSSSDTVQLVRNMSALSYRNEPMLELCIRHISNNSGNLSKDEFKILVDSCTALQYSSDVLCNIETKVPCDKQAEPKKTAKSRGRRESAT